MTRTLAGDDERRHQPDERAQQVPRGRSRRRPARSERRTPARSRRPYMASTVEPNVRTTTTRSTNTTSVTPGYSAPAEPRQQRGREQGAPAPQRRRALVAGPLGLRLLGRVEVLRDPVDPVGVLVPVLVAVRVGSSTARRLGSNARVCPSFAATHGRAARRAPRVAQSPPPLQPPPPRRPARGDGRRLRTQHRGPDQSSSVSTVVARRSGSAASVSSASGSPSATTSVSAATTSSGEVRSAGVGRERAAQRHRRQRPEAVEVHVAGPGARQHGLQRPAAERVAGPWRRTRAPPPSPRSRTRRPARRRPAARAPGTRGCPGPARRR